jgi:tetratricopeptide (TPR) repeat protein
MFTKYLCAGLFMLGLLTEACHSNEGTLNESKTGDQKTADPFSTLENQLHADSTNLNIRLMLASKYYAAGQLAKAASQFSRAYEQDQKNLIALTNLGNIAYDSNQDDKAIGYYEKEIALDPANLNVRCDLATCYARINKLNNAIEILRQNIKIDSLHQKSHYNLAVILQKKGETKESGEEMKIYTALTGGQKH